MFNARHLIEICSYYIFSHKLNVSVNPASTKSIGIIFPRACVHFPSLCHILVILTIFQDFSLLSCSLWWSVISGLWCDYYNCFGNHESCPYKMDSLINKYCMCPDCSTDWLFIPLFLFLSSSLSISTILKSDQIIAL